VKNPDLANQLRRVDELIKSNETDAALELLERLATTDVPREYRVEMAALSRRLRAPDLGLRLLHPFIRPVFPLRIPATPAETAEYGALLYRSGALDEAQKVLATITPEQFPKVRLYSAFICQTKWEYAAAIPLFEAFLASIPAGDYDALIAEVNLVACEIFCEQHRADVPASERFAVPLSRLERLLAETKKRGLALLEMNCLELSAQIAVRQKRFDDAERFLSGASHPGGQHSLDAFFVEKWTAILKMERHNCAPEEQERRRLREKAEKLGHWESVRDLDLQFGLYGRDLQLLEKTYVGTPFAAYGKHVERLYEIRFGEPFPVPNSFQWNLDGSVGNPVTLDLTHGKNSTSKVTLKPNQVPHRLLLALTQDFYRPQRLAELHAFVFPNDFYSPESSPGRVHQSIFRLKEFFVAAKIPLFIDERKGFFALKTNSPVPVKITVRRCIEETALPEAHPRILAALNKLPARLRQRAFKASELAQTLKLPKRTVNRYLADAVRVQILERRGRGLRTEYAFPESRQKT